MLPALSTSIRPSGMPIWGLGSTAPGLVMLHIMVQDQWTCLVVMGLLLSRLAMSVTATPTP